MPLYTTTKSNTAEKNSAQTNKQTNKQTDRHYENNGHLAVNQKFGLAASSVTGLAATSSHMEVVCV